MALQPYISQLQAGKSLDAQQAEAAFSELIGGKASEEVAASFLLALKSKGENIAEIVAAAQVMRSRMVTAHAPEGAMDVCGTGGDGKGSLNISTAVAFVVAACGVPVAKHGNRAVTSQSGSMDVLAALGILPSADAGFIATCFERAGICFLSAPDFHPALAALAPVRKKLGTRTIFNLLGPLCNPAGVRRQLVGVYDAMRVQPMAEALRQLGSESAWVVHGGDGSDELSIGGTSVVAALRENTVRVFQLPLPDQFAAPEPESLKGADAAHNAAALRGLLTGERSGYRDTVLLNAGAALVAGGKASGITDGVMLAADALDSGRACDVVNHLISLSRT